MFYTYLPPVDKICKYKCIYKGYKEVITTSDFDPNSFVKMESKSPDLLEIWIQKFFTESTQTWDRIYKSK